ncbi:MAG: hypothetical protein ABI396_19590 [Ktedonobacteraceae bacterium]
MTIENQHDPFPSESRSEVARLRQQITLEYEAATRGLHGLSQGSAQHAYITQRMENMASYHAHLQQLVGEDEAIKLLVATLEQAR